VLDELNVEDWAVNSSFSNQKLYGFVAHIQGSSDLLSNTVAETYPVSSVGVHQLLQDLNCLQCRAVLLEWVLRRNAFAQSKNSEQCEFETVSDA